jgi:hypothetical protein
MAAPRFAGSAIQALVAASPAVHIQYMVMPEAQAAATIMVSGWLTGAKLREMVMKKGTEMMAKAVGVGNSGDMTGRAENWSSVSSSMSLSNSISHHFAAFLVCLGGGEVEVDSEGAVSGPRPGAAEADFEGGCAFEGRGCTGKLFIRRKLVGLVGGNAWVHADLILRKDQVHCYGLESE